MMGYRRDVAAFITLAVVRGLSAPVFEVGLQSLPVLLLAAVRFDLAGLILFAYVVGTETVWRPRTRGDVVAIGAGSVLIFTLSTAMWSIGQELTSAALSGLVASLLPVVTAGFSWLLLPNDRLSAVGRVGLGVGFGGALLMLLPGGGVHFEAGVAGKLLMGAGVTLSGFGGVLIRWAEPTLPAPSQTAWSLTVGALLLHVISLVVEGSAVAVDPTLSGLVAVVFLGTVSGALGQGIFYWLLGRRPAVEVNLVSYVSPVLAAGIGWFVLGETVTAGMIIGFGAVVVGFVLIKWNVIRTEML